MKILILIGLVFIVITILIYYMIINYLSSRLSSKDYFYKYVSKDWWLIKFLDGQLKNADYWLTLKQAIIVQIVIIMAVVYLSAKNHNLLRQLQTGVVFFITFEVLFFIENYLQIRKRNNCIMFDLCQIQDTLRYQSGTGVEDSVILQAVYPRIKDRMLKECIRDIILAYTANQDIIVEIEKLKTISNNNNLMIFSNTLLKKHRIGKNDKNVNAQATILRRFASNIEIIKRKERHLKLITLVVILVIIYVILIVWPMILNVINRLEVLLR